MRTLQDTYAWCWEVSPAKPQTGEVHDVLVVDGTGVGGQSCFITSTPTYVVGWDFMPRENSVSWEAHLATMPPPAVVVCDGQKGVLLAHCPESGPLRVFSAAWCMYSVICTLSLLATRSLEAGQDLLEHFALIWDVQTEQEAGAWVAVFQEIYTHHAEFLSERSYSSTITTGRRSWWYTHRKARSAFRQIDTLIREGQLFVYVDESLKAQGIMVPRTSNRVEGGLNSGLKGQLYIHRGMPSYHQQKLVEWFLYARTEGQKPPRFCV